MTDDMQQIKDELSEANPDVLLCDGLDDAIIGIAERFGQPPVACYDTFKIIDILQSRDGMTEEGALEFFEYNILNAWVGENTPAFLTLLRIPELS